MLCARDLSGSDTLPFTQEFLAEMLGVRRTSVSLVAAHAATGRIDQIREGAHPDSRSGGSAGCGLRVLHNRQLHYRTLLRDNKN